MMTPEHARWDEFCERLGGPDGCDFKSLGPGPDQFTFKCKNDHTNAINILLEMGFGEPDIHASLDYFVERGGHCDCEILFNVDPAAREEQG